MAIKWPNRRTTAVHIRRKSSSQWMNLAVTSASTARADNLKQLLGPTTSPVPPTGISEVQTTFLRFSELPDELKMEIWSYAIPDVTFHLDELDLGSLRDYRYFSRSLGSAKGGHTVQMKLLATCRMSRLIVLETWRRVIAPVPDRDDMYCWNISSFTGWIVKTPSRTHKRLLYVGTPENVLKISDDKIEELRGRTNA